MSEELDSDIAFINQSKDPPLVLLISSLIKSLKRQNYFKNFAASLLIYIVTFFIFYFIKKQTLTLESNYYQFLGFLILSQIIGSILSNKFNLTIQHNLTEIFARLSLSLILSLGLLSMLLLLFHVSKISRELFISVIFCSVVIEAFYFLAISDRQRKIIQFKRIRLSITYLCVDGLILSIFCYFEMIKIIKTENLSEKHIIMFAVIYLSWLFAAAATHKFRLIYTSGSKWEASRLQIKFYLLIMSLVLLSFYLLHIKSTEWAYFAETVVKYSIVSGVLALFLFVEKITSKIDEPIVAFLKGHDIKSPVISYAVKNTSVKYSFNSMDETESLIKHKLEFKYLKEYEKVFSVLDLMIDLKSFDTRNSVIINSGEANDIALQHSGAYQLFINLNLLNNQFKVNNYIRQIKKTLVKGGVFVGALYPHLYRYNRYIKKYRFWIGNLFYFFDFIWKRIFPKLPVTRQIYFKFRKEKDQAISLAEGLGRLVYVGFKILDIAVVDNVVYFAAVTGEGPVNEKKNFYSLVFKMQRIGKGGKTIYVYKLRTMYPYSEFIQDYVYSVNGSANGDKIINDFRLPFWGKFFRKYWLDELPMLINLLKGDIKLVGVRPLSLAKFNQYPKELQDLRTSTTPGLVPPFYKDLPTTFEGLMESEKKYILAYQKNPIKTDVEYFFKALYNILIKKARSS